MRSFHLILLGSILSLTSLSGFANDDYITCPLTAMEFRSDLQGGNGTLMMYSFLCPSSREASVFTSRSRVDFEQLFHTFELYTSPNSVCWAVVHRRNFNTHSIACGKALPTGE